MISQKLSLKFPNESPFFFINPGFQRNRRCFLLFVCFRIFWDLSLKYFQFTDRGFNDHILPFLCHFLCFHVLSNFPWKKNYKLFSFFSIYFFVTFVIQNQFFFIYFFEKTFFFSVFFFLVMMSTIAKQTKNYEDFVRSFVQEEEKESKRNSFKSKYLLSFFFSTAGCILIFLANHTSIFSGSASQIVSVVGTVMSLAVLSIFWELYSITLHRPSNEVSSESMV